MEKLAENRLGEQRDFGAVEEQGVDQNTLVLEVPGDLMELRHDIIVGIPVFCEIAEIAVFASQVAVLVGHEGELDGLVVEASGVGEPRG